MGADSGLKKNWELLHTPAAVFGSEKLPGLTSVVPWAMACP